MFKKCNTCGQVVHILKNGNSLICCGKDMMELIPNSTDAAFEKHVPEYSINDNKIYVKVNHVMESDHYIEWIAIENDSEFYMKKLKPGENPEVIFDYIPNAIVYSYCNKHNLWKNEIKEA